MNQKATFIGFSAVIMWSLLALFTARTQGIPPFQLLAMTFSVGSLVGLMFVALKGKAGWQKLRQPPKAWAFGIAGLFGYHFFYFNALSNAPVVDASLIAYLWPLLIVVFSTFLPQEKLRWFHLVGALAGLGGASLLVVQKGGLTFSGQYSLGYLYAVGCALTWSLYSVFNKTQDSVPTESVAGFCLGTALLGFLCHLMMEQSVLPGPAQWLAIIGLGLGPVGLAFYTWDFGTKHGNLKMLGVFSYATPLLSTLILTFSGQAQLNWQLGVACVLISGGAMLASLDFFRRKSLTT